MHLIRVGDPTAAQAKARATRKGATKVSWLTNEGVFRTWERRGSRWVECQPHT